MPTTYALIPGAGGSAWYWHRVAPLLAATGAEAIAIELPADDDAADLSAYADTVVDAVAEVAGPLVLVAQSMGAFTAPIVVDACADRARSCWSTRWCRRPASRPGNGGRTPGSGPRASRTSSESA